MRLVGATDQPHKTPSRYELVSTLVKLENFLRLRVIITNPVRRWGSSRSKLRAALDLAHLELGVVRAPATPHYNLPSSAV